MAIVKRTFTPSEAERITGVDTDLQRRWRKDGHLPKTDRGWARFDPLELCRLAVLGKLARLMGPAAAVQIMEGQQGTNVATLTYLHAASQPGASVGVHVVTPSYRFARSDGHRPFAFSETQAQVALSGVDIVLDLEVLGRQVASAAGGPLQEDRDDA